MQEPTGERWELALQLLHEGQPVVWRHLCLRPEPEALLVQASSAWHRDVTEERAREDLVRARELFSGLVASDDRFREVIGTRAIRYELVIDYGNGAILAATLDGDDVRLERH